MELPLLRLHDVRGEFQALMAASHLCPKRWLLLQEADDLVSVGPAVFAAGHVNPVVLAIGGLEDELVKIAIVLNPVEPFAGCL